MPDDFQKGMYQDMQAQIAEKTKVLVEQHGIPRARAVEVARANVMMEAGIRSRILDHIMQVTVRAPAYANADADERLRILEAEIDTVAELIYDDIVRPAKEAVDGARAFVKFKFRSDLEQYLTEDDDGDDNDQATGSSDNGGERG